MQLDRHTVVPFTDCYCSGFDRTLPPNDGRSFLKWWHRKGFFPMTLRRFGFALKADLKLVGPFDATNPRVEDLNNHILRDIGLYRIEKPVDPRDRRQC